MSAGVDKFEAMTRILGIETSCDETAAAVVDAGRFVRSNIVASQIPIHERFGGVVPEIASRQHILAIDGIVERALSAAACSFRDLDAVAVTYGPGLSGPLMVGTTFAKGLALATGLPLIAVNHIEGHILSVWLTSDTGSPAPELPMVSLVASGGHTELYLVRAPGEYRLLGRTLDDAAGEAFDKVGRLLGLPYPGGPSIEKHAGEAMGISEQRPLPRAWLRGSYDFSFSGIKTAVAREVRSDGAADVTDLPRERTVALAQAFQASVADVLADKLAAAAEAFDARSAALVGGVANNGFIRAAASERLNVELHFPEAGLSSDNAAMIAGAAFWNPRPAGLDLDVTPSLEI
jgi:N6-L-threonylcarbamoyladenine synthase